ncbi:hypothetical protein SCAR479_06018 [Seiridium cardinale]|uniref:Uncharacterized protein n=1 Tax=Seiridium cardinale TaxID=138064 RepID=A0ABR2XU07_9PEZI
MESSSHAVAPNLKYQAKEPLPTTFWTGSADVRASRQGLPVRIECQPEQFIGGGLEGRRSKTGYAPMHDAQNDLPSFRSDAILDKTEEAQAVTSKAVPQYARDHACTMGLTRIPLPNARLVSSWADSTTGVRCGPTVPALLTNALLVPPTLKDTARPRIKHCRYDGTFFHRRPCHCEMAHPQ